MFSANPEDGSYDIVGAKTDAMNWLDIDKCDLSPRDRSELWGEIPGKQTPVMPPELCEYLIKAAAKPDPPKRKFPFTTESNEIYQYPSSLFPNNEIVTHTILLNKHIKDMHELLKNLDGMELIIECPRTPDPPDVKPEILPEGSVYNFNLGTAPPYPHLDEKFKRQVLTKSVIRILAQLGMDKAKKSVVRVLVDVLIEFLTKVTRVCHNLAQHDLNKDHIAYDDVLTHSFQIMGVPNVLEITEYYNKEVIGRRDRQLAKSEHLVNVYNNRVEKLKTERAAKIAAAKKSTNLTNISETFQGLVQPGFQALHLIDTSPSSLLNPVPGPSGVGGMRVIIKKQKK